MITPGKFVVRPSRMKGLVTNFHQDFIKLKFSPLTSHEAPEFSSHIQYWDPFYFQKFWCIGSLYWIFKLKCLREEGGKHGAPWSVTLHECRLSFYPPSLPASPSNSSARTAGEYSRQSDDSDREHLPLGGFSVVIPQLLLPPPSLVPQTHSLAGKKSSNAQDSWLALRYAQLPQCAAH